MVLFFIVLVALLLIFVAILVFLFKFAFVRASLAMASDLDSALNRPLRPYRVQIEQGQDFIFNHPFEWKTTQSFDGLRLAARFYRKEGADRTMILFHGYRSIGARDFSCAVKAYYNMGMNVLLVDQRAHGESEGKLITFGIKERRDVLSWIEFVLATEGEDAKIFLGGMSMGATTVLLSVGLGLPRNVKGIIADCGYTSPVDIIKKVAKESFKVKGTVIIPLLDLGCRLFGKFSLYGVSTPEALRGNDIPLLFIHGKKDGFVPCDMSSQAYEAADGTKKIILVDDADHGFSYLVDTERVSRELETFISENS